MKLNKLIMKIVRSIYHQNRVNKDLRTVLFKSDDMCKQMAKVIVQCSNYAGGHPNIEYFCTPEVKLKSIRNLTDDFIVKHGLETNMTNKEQTINNVDVSGCAFYTEFIKFPKPYGMRGTAVGYGFCVFNLPNDAKLVSGSNFDIPRCHNNPNCHYKQLASKEEIE